MPRKKEIKPLWSSGNHDARIPQWVKERLFDRQKGLCGLCGLPLSLSRRPNHIDHILPLEDGGEHAESNLLIVHEHCHKTKTSSENKSRAKAKRIWTKNNGLKEPSEFAKRYARIKSQWKKDWKTGRMIRRTSE